MRYREALAEGTAALEKAGIETAKLDAWYLLEHVRHITRAVFLFKRYRELKEEKAGISERYLHKRAENVHFSILPVNRNSWDMNFKVNENVLFQDRIQRFW